MAKGNAGKGKKGWQSKDKGEGKNSNNRTCFVCQKKGHWAKNCPEVKQLRDKNNGQSEGANKAEVEKAAAVTEFAGQASDVSDFKVNSTSCNIFHWNTDTGATSSMTPHKSWIRNYKPHRVPIRLADNSVIYSEGIGSVCFRPLINNTHARDIEFTKVLHVPALCNMLLAVLHLTKYKGIDVLISKSKMSFIDQHKNTLFTATIGKDEIGYLDGFTIDNMEKAHLVSTLPLDLSLWHKQLGHHKYDDIKRMMSKHLVDGMVLDSDAKPDPICEPCLAGKMHANPFPLSENCATELLELIHSDVHQIGITSPSGYNYWISFIDDFSRYKVLVPLKHKSDAFSAFKSYKAYAEKQLGKSIKCLRDDKGGEYMSNEFNSYLDACGIVRQHTCRNRPQQNGVAERANRLFAERIVALLNESGLSKKFWVECLAALVHVLNVCPTSALVGKTPYEVWNSRKPDISHLRVWGCLAYVHVQKDKCAKLGSHMEKCIFIGYPSGYKGWKFYNPETEKVIISERADFDERFTYKGGQLSAQRDTYVHLPPIDPLSDEHNIGPYIPEPVEVEPEPQEPHTESESDDDPPFNAPDPMPQRPSTPELPAEPVVDNHPIAVHRTKRNVRPSR